MGSQGSGSDSIGVTRNRNQNQTNEPLSRQGSMYNLTLEEVQNHLGDLGKPLSSMNLDELLKTVFNNETTESVSMGPTLGGSSGPPLNRQSSLTLSRDLREKTVDEVWQHIQQEQGRTSLDRKTTFCEITLEDFLVKAGVVAESAPAKKNPGSGISGIDLEEEAQWMSYQMPTPVFMSADHSIPLSGNHMLDASFPDAQMNMSSSPLMGTLSDTHTFGRKRVAPGDIAEKSVERRQKRMIKNRESAARSRARKQAYTHELENKVSLLEEENERLKRQKYLQEWENTSIPAIQHPAPKYQLRRTSSAPR